MRKYLIVLVALLLLSISTVQLFAQTYAFHQNDQVTIKKGLSYAWVRERPTSECACVVVAINSSKQILRILESSPFSDGIQNWWHVTTTTGTIKQGWIEEQSLRLYKASSPAKPTLSSTQQPRQFSGAGVQIREGVSFIWLRAQPSSSSGVVSTINFFHPTSRSQCLTLGTVPGTVKWDGQQWWRYINSSSNSTSGWVEENSLVDCNLQASAVPTSGPNVVPTSTSVETVMPPITTYAAYQPFQNGLMIWRQDTQEVYVLIINGGPSQISLDSYAGLPEPTDVAPAAYYTPVNAFGKVWNSSYCCNPPSAQQYRDVLGWAIAREQGYTATISGYVLASAAKPDKVTYITIPDGRTVEISSGLLRWGFR